LQNGRIAELQKGIAGRDEGRKGGSLRSFTSCNPVIL
jgi:hypothetical protein